LGVSYLAYPNLLGTKGYVVVVVVYILICNNNSFLNEKGKKYDKSVSVQTTLIERENTGSITFA
jgi:hypothetical protein